jgi:tRNA A37 threonylcarbamoyladenosine dehydratase
MAEWTEEQNFYSKEGLTNLQNANVLVVGLGGVGSFAAEF